MDDYSFSSYHSHLAQMPTDQQELEYHHPPVQTTGAEETPPASALQPYNSEVTSWATSRSSLTSRSMDSQRHSESSEFWDFSSSGHFEHRASYIPRSFSSANSTHSSFYTPSPNLATMDPPPASMGPGMRPVPSAVDFFPAPHDSSLPSTWIGQQSSHYHHHHHHAIKVEDPDGTSQHIYTADSSPISVNSPHYHSTTTSMTTMDSPKAVFSGDEGAPSEPPYSQLIYQALRGAKDHKLQLQDIYYWFETNTSKGSGEQGKGWQNSIRHNLSMNAGFIPIKGESSGGKKAVNYWSLTPEAIRNGGVESTTRYRRSSNQFKVTKPKAKEAEPSNKRRGSQRRAKQNAAAPKPTNARRSNQIKSEHRSPSQHPAPQPSAPQLPPPMEVAHPVPELPAYHMPPMASGMERMMEPMMPPAFEPVQNTLYFDYGRVTGLANDPPAEGARVYEHEDMVPPWECTLQMRQRF